MSNIKVIYLENAEDFGYDAAWVHEVGGNMKSAFINNFHLLGHLPSLEQAKDLIILKAPNAGVSPVWRNGYVQA